MTTPLVTLLILVMAAGAVLGWLYRKAVERQERLEEQVKELTEIVKRRRLPYPAAAGLEDAIAIAIEVLDRNQAEMAYENTRIGQLAERLRQVRSDPHGYDMNQADKPER